MRRSTGLLSIVFAGILAFGQPAPAAEPAAYRAGVARIDITPDFPVRLAGFGNRRDESEGVTQRIHAKALAIDVGGDPLVLITADLCGMPETFTDELAKRLQSAGVQRERFALSVSHSHTTPMVSGYLRTLFGMPIPPEHQRHIDRFTAELLDKLEKVAKNALADRRPARLSWGVGTVGFAMNRRTKSAPTDHDLPVLAVRDPDGKLRAIWASYACHCVTLSNNKLSGDWAGFAQEAVETEFPGVVGLVSIGCGADQNPNSGVTGDKVEVATAQGRQVAAEVKRLVGGFLAPINGPIGARAEKVVLPLAVSPRSTWEEKAKPSPNQPAISYHAQAQLARLDRGESLATKVDYTVRAWTFGDGLALVFLPGEVVVDYGLRLKRELDGRRVWINAYSNDVPCYIPSERVRKEGGYEGAGAMVYYDLPGPFQPGLEQPIVDAVHHVVGDKFRSPFAPNKTQGSRPLSPQQALAAIRVRPGLAAELVAAEPLIASPVAIAFGPDSRLWVAEMYDYPAGTDGKLGPAGRIRVLRDTRGRGKFDESTIFLDNIPFPTGVTVWRNGVLVCAAPDILYAEDTDGDGKADVVKKLYSGFGTHNYQARVNSLEYGLDGWVYGSCGLFGGTITGFTGKTLNLGDRDFRIKPDTGEIEPATGRTQQGRVRDDWDNWFGCDNMHLAWHYPLADHYVRRNPHAAPPNPGVNLPAGKDATRLFPAGNLQLFKLSGPPGRPTAVCGLGVYRDDLLGPDFTGNLFSCEPVNLLIHRLRLEPRGSTFAGARATGEEQAEFLSSTDPWFRPVQACTGPDGCLWVVDMARYVIEHPRWIPPEDLAKLDVRAGATLGRIYRIRPKDREPRPATRLDQRDAVGLVAALDSPNGWQRDLATQMLLWRGTKDVVRALAKLSADCPRAEARLHAIVALDGLGQLSPELVRRALADTHAGIRRNSARLAEQFLNVDDLTGLKLAVLTKDPDAQVRLQAACSLGQWKDAWAGRGLANLALSHPADPYLTAAVLSSIHRGNVAGALATLIDVSPDSAPLLLPPLLATAAALGERDGTNRALRSLAAEATNRRSMSALAAVLDALDRGGRTLEAVADSDTQTQIVGAIDRARLVAANATAGEADRVAAVTLLGRGRQDADRDALGRLLTPQHPAAIQSAAAVALARIPGDQAAAVLLAGWSGYSPALKTQTLDLLQSRRGGPMQLLDAIESNTVAAAQLDATRRQGLLSHKDAVVRSRAAKIFAAAISPDRQKVVEAYQDVVKQTGNAVHGRTVFGKSCSVCHRLEGVGQSVGPDLAALQNKSWEYLLQEVLDPNRNTDSRYMEYRAITKAGRTYTGLLSAESATSVTLRAPEGREQVLLRGEIEELESTGRSLMPEGLEKDLSRQDLADVFAYLVNPGAVGQQAGTAPAGPELAKQILDDARPPSERQAVVEQNPGRAGELVAAIVADLPPGAKEEYRRIPWVWRVAIAAGKRNDATELRRLLDVALPKADEPLRDWQAVVIGGGVINGLSQAVVWPKPRVAEVIGQDAELIRRWRQARDQAAEMADNGKAPPGTRYDALRMIALGSWEKRGPQLVKYLARDAHPELQMGAVSGLSDMDAAPVAERLINALGDLTPRNRGLALDALLRTETRSAALLDAVERGRLAAALVDQGHRQALRSSANPALRTRAAKVFP